MIGDPTYIFHFHIICYNKSHHNDACEHNNIGPNIISIMDVKDSPWHAPVEEYSCIGDPCDFVMTSLWYVYTFFEHHYIYV